MGTFGIIQGTTYRAPSGALYDIKSHIFQEDQITCGTCGRDVLLKAARSTGECPSCSAVL